MSEIIMNDAAILNSMKRISHEIIEHHSDIEKVAIIGIQRRGVSLAKMIVDFLKEFTGVDVDFGILDITLYRDDLSLLSEHPIIKDTDVHFIVDNKDIILVDDVIYTGRTTLAAINALFDLGRPDSLELAVLVDRGHRQIPIKANYVGKNIPTQVHKRVEVKVPEFDNDFCVNITDKRLENNNA